MLSKSQDVKFISKSSKGAFIKKSDRNPNRIASKDNSLSETSEILCRTIDSYLPTAELQFKSTLEISHNPNALVSIDNAFNILNEQSDNSIRRKRPRLPDSSENRNPNARKKKQCPVCKLFFANITTHKRTHLAPDEKPHKCPTCNLGFSRNFDFLRHQKEHMQRDLLNSKNSELPEHEKLIILHNTNTVFRCPYNKALIKLDLELYTHKSEPSGPAIVDCHGTGLFLRKDNLRNHLRSHHFVFDEITENKRKSYMSPGACKVCGKWFQNTTEWTNNHCGKTCGYHFH